MDPMEKDRAVFAANMALDEPYTLGPDSFAQAGVPRGEITRHHWSSTKIYPGTERDYWLYVPQQYDGTSPVCLMVFQDGDQYLGPQVNTAVVFDNLIHKGDMPVTIGLFVAPGDIGPGHLVYGGTDNRSFEYDSLGDQYARFLIEELLPPIEQEYRIVADRSWTRDLWPEFRRHLRVHRSLGTPRRFLQGSQPLRQLRRHARRLCVSYADSQNSGQAAARVPADRRP